jgi:hypothetical protein
LNVKRLVMLAALAVFDVASCRPVAEGQRDDDETIPPPPYASFDERPCPSDSVLTWENFGEPFMRSWCTGCHSSSQPVDRRLGAPVEINFDDLDGVREHASRVWSRSADQNNTMPPAGLPPEDERNDLGEWLACGARSRNDGPDN